MPAPVLTEVGYLLEREKGARAEAAFLRSIRAGEVLMIALGAADVDRMAELVESYADFPLGLVDASVIAVAERLGADSIATLDRRHFSVVRPGTGQRLPSCPTAIKQATHSIGDRGLVVLSKARSAPWSAGA